MRIAFPYKDFLTVEVLTLLLIVLVSFEHVFEPSHEIMVLFVFRKLILQTRMLSHPVGLDV